MVYRTAENGWIFPVRKLLYSHNQMVIFKVISRCPTLSNFPSFWENNNNSLTWIKAIWGWFPLLTMIPVRENSKFVIIYPDMSIGSGQVSWSHEKRCQTSWASDSSRGLSEACQLFKAPQGIRRAPVRWPSCFTPIAIANMINLWSWKLGLYIMLHRKWWFVDNWCELKLVFSIDN